MVGILAFDIDGTLTLDAHTMPAVVLAKLNQCREKGWDLLFITGRPFAWAFPLFKSLNKNYLLAVHNGAILLSMPERKMIAKWVLDKSILAKIDQLVGDDYAVFSGYENNDIIYFRKDRFSQEMVSYLEYRRQTVNETWVAVKSWDEMPCTTFPAIKWIGPFAELAKIEEKLKSFLHIPVIKDPFNSDFGVAQATHPEATKGHPLKYWMEKHPNKRPVVAAGDDWNDVEMFKLADTVIVMEDAPKELLKMADIVAPNASDNGIVQALDKYGI